ncbi:MAG: hypothetical protein QOF16_129 [Actinomycetota bacterium]|nr:hypothetical protein [Actinomycetota bacterium]
MTGLAEIGLALCDEGSFEPADGPTSSDPLSYPGYLDNLRSTSERAGSDEAVVTGAARIGGY